MCINCLVLWGQLCHFTCFSGIRMSFNFQNKKILVTGAGRGLGRQLAIKLVEAGANVYAVSRTESTLETLKEQYPSITTITLDLSDWERTREVLKQLEPMDGLVNNAAVVPNMVYTAMTADVSTMNTFIKNNLYSSINCTQIIAEKMISEGKGGSIVNVSSTGSLGSSCTGFPYCLSKVGLDLVTKQFALELGAHNIRVNSINPTLFLTEGGKKTADIKSIPIVEKLLSTTPMKRLPEIDEIVGPVLYLLSDLSTMVNGTIQVVDGGKFSVNLF